MPFKKSEYRNMKSFVVASLSLLAMVGCSSPNELSTRPLGSSNQVVQNLEQVNWQEVSIPSHFYLNIDEASQRVATQTIEGAIGAFSFPITQAGVILELTSAVKDLKVFAPNAAIYDQDFNLLKTYTATDFDYDRNDFITGEALHGEVSFVVPMNVSLIHVAIYTTAEDLEQQTVLIHPAKAMAIAKRTEPPKISDPVATHVNKGVVDVVLKQFTASNMSGESKGISKSVPYAQRVPEVSIQPETQSYYHTSIEKAVQAGDIPKALSLLDEAKALGVEGAQEAFVKAVNAK